MSEKKTTTVKTKRKLSKPALVLVVGLCIIFIPLLVFGGILLSAALQTGTPVLGDRFKGDLDPAIKNQDIEKLKKEIATISNVESVEIELKTAQLRINIDTKDSVTTEQIESIVESAYSKVNQVLSIGTYFTSTDSKKMYDLAINGYNFIDGDSDSMIYYILTKNAMMEAPSTQLVSEPLDEELASELRGENLPTETEPGETEGTEE